MYVKTRHPVLQLSYLDIDDCLANNCQNNATCEDQINSYNCKCTAGFTGENCTEQIDALEANEGTMMIISS